MYVCVCTVLPKWLLKEHFNDDFLLAAFCDLHTRDEQLFGIVDLLVRRVFVVQYYFDWLDNILAGEKNTHSQPVTYAYDLACTHIKLPKWWKTRNPISHVYFIVNKTYASCVQQHHIATIITTGNGHHFELIPYCFSFAVRVLVFVLFFLSFHYLFAWPKRI